MITLFRIMIRVATKQVFMLCGDCFDGVLYNIDDFINNSGYISYKYLCANKVKLPPTPTEEGPNYRDWTTVAKIENPSKYLHAYIDAFIDLYTQCDDNLATVEEAILKDGIIKLDVENISTNKFSVKLLPDTDPEKDALLPYQCPGLHARMCLYASPKALVLMRTLYKGIRLTEGFCLPNREIEEELISKDLLVNAIIICTFAKNVKYTDPIVQKTLYKLMDEFEAIRPEKGQTKAEIFLATKRNLNPIDKKGDYVMPKANKTNTVSEAPATAVSEAPATAVSEAPASNKAGEWEVVIEAPTETVVKAKRSRATAKAVMETPVADVVAEETAKAVEETPAVKAPAKRKAKAKGPFSPIESATSKGEAYLEEGKIYVFGKMCYEVVKFVKNNPKTQMYLVKDKAGNQCVKSLKKADVSDLVPLDEFSGRASTAKSITLRHAYIIAKKAAPKAAVLTFVKKALQSKGLMEYVSKKIGSRECMTYVFTGNVGKNYRLFLSNLDLIIAEINATI